PRMPLPRARMRAPRAVVVAAVAARAVTRSARPSPRAQRAARGPRSRHPVPLARPTATRTAPAPTTATRRRSTATASRHRSVVAAVAAAVARRPPAPDRAAQIAEASPACAGGASAFLRDVIGADAGRGGYTQVTRTTEMIISRNHEMSLLG